MVETGNNALRVLVVSDDFECRTLVGEVVEELGHRLEFRCDSDDAAEQDPGEHPSLAIVDWDLGAEATSALVGSLRRPAGSGRSYVLVIARDLSDESCLGGIDSCRSDDFLVGPLSKAELAFRIRVAERRICEDPGYRRALLEPGEQAEILVPAAFGLVDGWWDWDVRSDTVHYSSTWLAMLGYDEDEAEANADFWRDLVHPDDLEPLRAALQELVDGGLRQLEHGHRLRFKDGTYRWVLSRGFAIRDPGGVAQRVIGLQTDVTEQMHAEQRLEYEAVHDELTGLPNRTLFIDRLHQAFLRVQRRPDLTFAVLFLDLDRFKNVNDSLGHAAGDRLLRAVASRLDAALRPSDTVARFGGDEFVVLIEDITGVHSAKVVAQRVQQEFREPFDLQGMEVFSDISLGIAVWSRRYQQPDDLLRDADTAMSRAKAMGKNRYIVFDEEMHHKAVAALSLEDDLRRALERQEFAVYYQPIVALDRGRITGFEALVRWQHPSRGLVLPADFIPLAEEIGLVIPIDRWVLEEACRQLRAWQVKYRQKPELTVNVNVSGIQFMQPDLIAQIDYILRKTGLYGRSLTLEITESLIMEDAGYAGEMIEQLKRSSISICIDDFGTGYSSLAYLRRFEIDALKIDRSFVSRMLNDAESLEIVRTITTLGANLEKVTVVEGVETATQLELLRSIGADRVQGYYVSQPVPGDEAGQLLESAFHTEDHLAALLQRRRSSNR